MNSSMYGKIEKAKRYSTEPERVRLNALEVSFRGSNDQHTITLRDAEWHCDCHFFASLDAGTCSHVMALQRLFSPMLSAEVKSEHHELLTVGD